MTTNQQLRRLFSRAALVLLLLLTSATVWAQDEWTDEYYWDDTHHLCYVLNGTTASVCNFYDYGEDHDEPTGAITIPASITNPQTSATYNVTSIAEGAFVGCEDLTSVVIGDNVTTIGARAFEGCTGITSVTFGSSVKTIGANAFDGCEELTTLNFSGNSIRTIGNEAFTGGTHCTATTEPHTFGTYGECAACHLVSLADNASNTDVIGHWSTQGGTHSVVLTGRTLFKDGSWNTLCLPFNIDDFAGTPLEGATVMTLGNSSGCNTRFDANTGTLYLEFVDASDIEAGNTYIVKWETAGDPVTNPTFTGITLQNEDPADHYVISEDGTVSFLGTYSPVVLPANDKSNLFLGSGNQLHWPTANVTLNAFRCYFQLDLSDPNNQVKDFVLNFGEGEATSIHNSQLTIDNEAGAWYDLSGRKVNGQLPRGIYIHNGKKVVIK